MPQALRDYLFGANDLSEVTASLEKLLEHHSPKLARLKEGNETTSFSPLKATDGERSGQNSTRANSDIKAPSAESAQAVSREEWVCESTAKQSEGSITNGGVSARDDGDLPASSAVVVDDQSTEKV